MSSDDLGATTTSCGNNVLRRIPRPRPRQISVTTSLVPLVEGAKPFQASDYDFGSVLGSGTFATVKLVRRRCDGQQFALKTFCASDEETRECVSKEYRIHASFRHPCIVSVDALYMQGCTLYLCMEYSEGGSVDNHIKRHGSMSEDTAQRLFSDLLQGVDHIHCKRVVHRDLKPQNLVLDASASRLKITDFGSATELASNQHFNMLTGKAGTALFLPPEVHFGYNWNERVDIWACGLCFYFMLRGDLPFDLQSRKVRRTLQKGCIPSWSAQNFSLLTEDMLQQCLKVAVWDRPPAMELRLHPMFKRTPSANFERQSSEGDLDLDFDLSSQPHFSFERQKSTSIADPKSFYTLLKSCGLVCVHPLQKVESPSAHQGNNTLQALAEVKCLRSVKKMARGGGKDQTTCNLEDYDKESSYSSSVLESGPSIFQVRSFEDFFDDQVPGENIRRVNKNLFTRMKSGGSVEGDFDRFNLFTRMKSSGSIESDFDRVKEDSTPHWSRQWSTDD